MGNTNVQLYEDQMKILQDKLHKPNPNLKIDNLKTEKITRMKATELRSQLLSNSGLSVQDIVKTFHFRKMQENNEHRALADVFYEQPLGRAEELDKLINKQTVNPDNLPLLGFVMSIKESNKLKNTVCTNGFAINVGLMETQQPKSIKLLIEKGALITCKGNVPQALFSMESVNNVFGCACNPYNKLRTVGGSSGGDSALVALRCVNSAIGSDVAGSLRIPALFCGVVGYKPTIHRISNDQLCSYFYKQPFARTYADRNNIIRPTIGPIANSVDDAEALMKVLIQTSDYDRLVPPMPWRKVEKPKRVGLFTEFSQIEISPPNKRALHLAADALRKNGIEIVDLDLDEFFEEIFVTSAASFFKNDALRSVFEGKAPIKEPLIAAFKNFNRLVNLPHFLVRYLATKPTTDRRVYFMRAITLSRASNINSLEADVTNIYERFRIFLEKKGVEILLAPGMATPAVLHGSSNENSMQAVYTFMFNLLDMATGVLPITRVAADEQHYVTKYKDIIALSLEKSMKESEGLPVGIQVAGLAWMDEHVFEVMRIIEKEVQYK